MTTLCREWLNMTLGWAAPMNMSADEYAAYRLPYLQEEAVWRGSE